MTEHKVPVQSLIDHIKTAVDVDPWAKEMAEELLKAQDVPETNVGKWISVKDRLPERKWIDYLVATNIQNDGTRGFNIAWLNDDNGVWKSNDEWICDGREIVTHWMPLPEPPKEES